MSISNAPKTASAGAERGISVLNEGFTRRASLGALITATAGAGTTMPSRGAAADFEYSINSIFAVSREELSTLGHSQQFAYLLEEGRSGLFKWMSGDLGEMIRADPMQGIYITSHDDPGGTRGAWGRMVEGDIQLVWFGAKFDVGKVTAIVDASDDSDAWEAALAYLNFIGGGTLRLPHGASKITRQIDVPFNSIRIVGTGTRKIYPGRFAVGTTCPSTLVPVHDDRNAFRFTTAVAGGGSFCAEDFNLATLEAGPRPVAAFGWETHQAFPYGFTFHRIGIHGFTSAFDSYKNSGNENAVGAVLIDDCTINRNQWIARTLDQTQFNGFCFTNNKAGQNGYQPGTGGIAISGHNVTIDDNILEGMRDPVSVLGGYRSISVKGNYFEANAGQACVRLRDVWGPYSIGPNNYGLLDYGIIDHKVLLEFCGLGSCIDPYWPCVTQKLPRPLTGGVPASSLKNDVDSAEYGFCRLDQVDGGNWSIAPRMIASAVPQVPGFERETNPLTGDAMSVQAYRTTGPGYAAHRCTIEGRAGEWVVMSWLFKRQPDDGKMVHPYVSMRINGEASGGSRDYPAFNFPQAWREGEWCLMTAAIRLKTEMSFISLLLYPHGVKADEGRSSRYLPPIVYTVRDINDAAPFIDQRAARMAKNPPQAGEWFAGDVLINTEPRPNSTRFICTSSGTPGTWIAS